MKKRRNYKKIYKEFVFNLSNVIEKGSYLGEPMDLEHFIEYIEEGCNRDILIIRRTTDIIMGCIIRWGVNTPEGERLTITFNSYKNNLSIDKDGEVLRYYSYVLAHDTNNKLNNFLMVKDF